MPIHTAPAELSVTFPAISVDTVKMKEGLIVPMHELGTIALSAFRHADSRLWPIGRSALDFLRGASKFVGIDNTPSDDAPEYTAVQNHTFGYTPLDREEGLDLADIFVGQYPVSGITVDYEVQAGGLPTLVLDANAQLDGHPQHSSQYARLSASVEDSEYTLTMTAGGITHAGILEPSEGLSFDQLRDWRAMLWGLRGERVS